MARAAPAILLPVVHQHVGLQRQRHGRVRGTHAPSRREQTL
jgi:hypothetical protein